jgi:hypothetical protein
MKKPLRKLAVNRETIQQLSSQAASHVAGGGATQIGCQPYSTLPTTCLAPPSAQFSQCSLC